MKKVLIVTYFWPPAGGPGVQRVLKFVKYLPNFGWQPIILTVANGEYAAVDPTLEKNIPKNIRVYKTKYIEPFSFYKKFLGIKNEQNIPTAVLAENTTNRKQKVANWIRLNLFIPDAKIGWKYFAVKEGLKIIKSERPNLIYSSSPPPTVHLIAKSLSQKSKLRWIADFRDPWTDIHYYENQKRLEISKNLDLKLEKNVLQEADKITCISQLDIEEDFGKKTDIGKCINIPNGYDEEDFYDLNTNRTNKNIFTLLHLGAVNSERNPIGLFEALKNLKQNKFIDSSVFQFVFVGKVENVIKETITEFEIEDLISFIDYLPHQQALKYLEEAAMLILLITNSEKNRRILPGKTFEYLRAQKFVLGLGPTDGEVSRIINKVQSGEVVNYTDKVKIEKIIKQQFNSWHRDLLDYISSKEVIAQYNRENLTKKLANIFDELIIKKMKSVKNKYLFFITRIWKDIFNPTIWPLSNDLWNQQLGEYYFVFTEDAMVNQKGGQKSIVYDENGIPMNPTYIDVKDKDFVYYPITIGQVGLAVFHTYLKTNSDEDKKRFLKFPEWFKDNVIVDEKLGAYWLTDVPLPQYKNSGPWQSAFVQSRAISNLLRGYQLTEKKEYADLAEMSLKSFTIPVKEGGVTSFTKFGPFYEEYTSSIPTCVLNGMIFSICGITDFVRVFPENKLAKKLYDDGIQTLKNSIMEFDLGYWSKYNLIEADWYPKNDPSTITYQHLHVTQLNMLYNLTHENIFKEYADKFEKQIKLINIARMYFSKYRALKKLGRL